MLGESDLLFHNRGDGTFEEVSKKAGVDDPNRKYGLGATWGDYDNDGWPDLYVANDAGPNFLYRNKHNGTFEEVGLLSGIALSSDGLEQGSMGVDWGVSPWLSRTSQNRVQRYTGILVSKVLPTSVEAPK
jgi:hypothetical protein